MSKLLNGDHIIKGPVNHNKASLFSANEFRENMLEMVCEEFSNSFKANVTEKDRTEIRNQLRIVFFRHKSNIGLTPRSRHNKISKEVLNNRNKCLLILE